jgi:hypothetical protein
VLVVEALERVVCPVTESVPPTVSLLATVEVPTDAVVAVRLVATALVVVELPTTRLVMEAKVATRDDMKPLVVVALVVVLLPIVTPVRFESVAKRLETKEFEEVLLVVLNAVTVAEAEVRSVIVPLVIVVVASVEVPDVLSVPESTVLPDTVSAVADALPRVDVPEVSVEKIPVVKVGLAERAIVLVEEKTMFDPAVRLATGLLKKVFQAVDEAVSGTEYPACVPRVKVWIPVEVDVVMVRLRPPDVEVANACDAAALPLSVEIVPPAPPASVPQ